MKKWSGFIVCCWLILLSPAQANGLSGETLLRLCQSDEVQDIHHCDGYIRGVIDYHNLTRSLGTAPTIDFCVPEAINAETLRQTVIQYLIQNRHHKEFIATPAIALALYETYSCR